MSRVSTYFLNALSDIEDEQRDLVNAIHKNKSIIVSDYENSNSAYEHIQDMSMKILTDIKKLNDSYIVGCTGCDKCE